MRTNMKKSSMYDEGYLAGVYSGKIVTGNISAWGSGVDPMRPCMVCGYRATATMFCPNCGRAMVNNRVRTGGVFNGH